MHASPLIRDSTESDIDAITAIYSEHVLHGLATFEISPPDAAEMAVRRAGVLARGLPYLVAELDGAVAGYAYAAPFRARPAYRYTLENSIYLRPDKLRRGVGRALLLALTDACASAGYRQMIAVIGDSANAASIGLHAACGFRHSGVLAGTGFKFGRWVDTVMMQKELGQGDRMFPDDLPLRGEEEDSR